MSAENSTDSSAPGGESTFTVVVAAVANLGIAVAKAIAGLISGSSAMLSEAAHSVADTVTEVLLLTALKRSEKRADDDGCMRARCCSLYVRIINVPLI